MYYMYEIYVDEFGQEVTLKHSVPCIAIRKYLETDSIEEVERFLKKEYTSEDTSNIIELCDRMGFPSFIVSEEITGVYY